MPLDFEKISLSTLTKKEEDQASMTPSVYDYASQQNPQQYASDLRLADQTGISMPVVQSNPAAVQSKLKLDQIDFEGMTQRSPVTDRFLSDYSNAVIAQDDIPILEAIESVFNVGRGLASGPMQFLGMGVEGIGTGAQALSNIAARGLDSLLPDSANKYLYKQDDAPPVVKFINENADVNRFLQTIGGRISEASESVAPAPEDQNYVTDVAAGVGQLAGQVAVTLMAPWLSTYLLAGSGVSQQQAKQEETDKVFNGDELNFVQRYLYPTDQPFIQNQDGSVSTHRMASAEVDGKFIVYPTIVQNENNELVELNDDEAFNYAVEKGEFLEFASDIEARQFAENGYKDLWGSGESKRKSGDNVSDMALLLGGISTFATERLGIEALLNRIPPKIKNDVVKAVADVFIAGGAEAVQEVVEGLAQNTIEKLSTNPDAQILTTDAAYEGAVGFGAGAIVRALIMTAMPNRMRRMQAETDDALTQGQVEQEKLRKLNELSTKSKLHELSPERFSQFIQQADGDNNTQVYLDAAQVSLYLRQQQEAEVAIEDDATLILLTEKVREAAVTGADIAIPVQDFATVIAGTTHFDQLRDAMTMSADSIAPIRQEQVRRETEGYMRNLVTEAQQNVSQYVESQEIYEAVRQQLVDTGMVNERNASVMAQVVPAWATTFAARNNISVAEAYQRGGLTITGPQTGRMAELQGEQVLSQARAVGYQGQDIGEAAQWRAAVQKFGEAGMTTEARMARAAEMGFDTETVLYHGSGENFANGGERITGNIDAFNPELSGKSSKTGAPAGTFFFSSDPEVASSYTVKWQGDFSETFKPGANVTPVLLKLDNPLVVDARGENWRDIEYNGEFYDINELTELVKSSGEYDGLIINNVIDEGVGNTSGNPATTTVVFDPSNIRSVNAAFDPDASDSADLLAQKVTGEVGPLGVYSGLSRFISELNLPAWKSGKETKGADVWAALKKAPLKQEELKWTGIEEFLTVDPDARFTREDVVQYVDDNGINIEEVVADRETTDEEVEWGDQEVDDDSSNWSHLTEDILYSFDNGNSEEFGFDINGWMTRWIEDNVETDDPESLVEDNDTRSDARSDFEEAADEWARDMYMNEPYVTVESNNIDGLRIYGNGDSGFQILYNGEDITTNWGTEIYSINEAELRASEWAQEQGLIGGTEDTDIAKWGQYTMAGPHRNYRELKLTLPDIEGDFYNDTHFPDRNIVAFLRVDDRKLRLPNKEEKGEAIPYGIEIFDNPLENAVVKKLIRVFHKETDQTIHQQGVDSNITKLGSEEAALAEVQERINAGLVRIGDFYFEEGGALYRSSEKGNISNTYFIDEFQSDWHQAGRQEGYKTGIDPGEIEQQASDIERQLTERFMETDPNSGGHTSYEVRVAMDFASSVAAEVISIDSVNPTYRELARYLIDGGFYNQNKPQFEQIEQLKKQANAERYGEADAPFKGDAWISLGLKRAIADAAANGYEAIAWPNGQVLADRWSERYLNLYETQYDKKMPSLVRKLTGVTPSLVNEKGESVKHQEMGYWIIPITDALRETVNQKGFPLFQRSPGPDARGYYDPANSIIRLTEAADLSTFLHEFAHFMYEMELKTGGQTKRDIDKWFKRNATAVAAEANQYMDEGRAAELQKMLPPGVVIPTAEQFHRNLQSAQQANPKGASVAVADVSEYENMLRFTMDNGRIGFAIEYDGNLVGVFKHPDSTVKGAMSKIMPLAIELGATRLNAFDINGYLPNEYKKYGFKETARDKWDDQYRPDNWNPADGTPDVVYMELDPAVAKESRSELTRKAVSWQIQNEARVRGSTGVLEQSGSQDQGNGREEDGSLRGLPRKVGQFTASVFKKAVDVADQYMASRGLTYAPPVNYTRVDVERAGRIADAFTAMQHNPQDPQVKAAYDAMIEETIAQYQAILDTGLVVEFIDFAEQGDPYEASPRMMTDDVRNNNHMWVFSTRDGFGSNDTFDPVDNPLLRETGYMISGKPALANDLFRVVHDYFGHVKEGVGFRADGEENAWRAHSAMYSPLARKAMTTETRGQNSWVNYGPFGEQNRNAPSSETVFADQKIGLLPDWVVDEGRTDDQSFQQSGDAPQGTTGSVNELDVANYLDNGTTGDAAKDSAIRRATHEQFARGWEQYLMEGKAPSVEMRNVFQKFARWLTKIYDAVKGNLNVNLDDGIRQVYDRMLATEEQIAMAQMRARAAPLFTDAAMAGMTEEQFAEYQTKQQEAEDKATETLRDKLIKQFTRQTKKWWKDEKDDMVVEETERLKNTPVYRAMDALRSGDMKLDKAVTKTMVAETAISRKGVEYPKVPARLNSMTIDGARGVHPDEAAAFLGYNSGSEMLNDIINAPTLKNAALEAAEQRMLKKHGDILNDGTIEQEADAAMQNEERAKLLLDELKVMAKGTSVPVIDRALIKSLAEENIAKLSFNGIHPGKYRKAEIRAAQEAAVAMEKGDRDLAARAKMRQVMNFYLGKAAQEARDNTLKIVDQMGRYTTKSVREEIMKAENGYWGQIVKILDRFEFRKSATLKSVDKVNEAVLAWMEKRIEQDGDGLVLSDAVLDETYVTHWKNVPYSDLQGINDSIKNIEHVARYGNKIKLMDEELQFKDLVDRWVAHIDSSVKTVFKPQRTTVAEGKQWGKWAMAQMTKVPFMASWLDGGVRVGLTHQILVQPFNDALNAQYKMQQQHLTPVVAAITNRSAEDRARHSRKVFIPEIKDANNDGNLMGHQILAVALNTGNAGNLKKMLLGEGWADPKDESTITKDNPQLQAVLAHMTKSDWDLVQLMWDEMDKLYPQLAEVHRRTTGLTPPKVEAVEVETPFGTYKGGYYPVKYDPARSQRAEENEQRQQAQVESMFSTIGSIQASVTASATSERTGYYAPIRLSLDVVPNHFQETIHYITHHDAVRQVNKLIRNKQVADVIKAKLGPEEFAQLKPWLNDIAKDGREGGDKTFVDKMASRLRFGLTLGIMGFKASTGIIQISGLSNAVAEVGSANMYQSMRMIFGGEKGTIDSMRSAWDFAVNNSKVLEFRTKTMDREMRSAMESLENKRGFMAAAQEMSMKHIAYIQTYMVDLPSWYAGYIKELGISGDEQKAYQYADWVVEQVQGSGATKDMSSLLRNQSGTLKLFTMFMTFFSSLWNMERDLARGFKSKQYSVTTLGAKAMFLFTLPILFEMFLRGEFGDDDDEESDIQKFLTTGALYAVGGVPFVRDVASGTIGDFGYNMSPVSSVLERGIGGIKELATRPFTDEEITKAQVKGASQLVGAAFGIPGTSQAWATGESIYQMLEEGEEIGFREVLFGPPRE
jgi:hypothetical protein